MREEGYYWVKYKGDWVIAEWAKLSKPCWFITGYNDVIPLNLITEIDERRIVRLTKQQWAKLEEVLDSHWDEGPFGAGWASYELLELRKAINSAPPPTQE